MSNALSKAPEAADAASGNPFSRYSRLLRNPLSGTAAWYPAVTLLLLGFGLVMGLWIRVTDDAILLRLKTGEQIWTTGAVPRGEIFSAALQGSEWVSGGWLWDMVAYRVHRSGGWFLLSAFKLAVIATALLLSLITGRLRGVPWTPLMVSALAVLPLVISDSRISPASAGLLLFGVMLTVLQAARTRPVALLALPFLTALWANLSVSLLIPAALLAINSAGWFLESFSGTTGIRRCAAGLLFLATVVALGAFLLNPYGLRLAELELEYVSNLVHHPDRVSLAAIPVMVVAALSALLFMTTRRELRLTDWLLAVVLTFLALLNGAAAPFLALALLPPLGAALNRLLLAAPLRRDDRMCSAVRLATLAGCVTLFSGSLLSYAPLRGAFGHGLQPNRFPERAASILDAMTVNGIVIASPKDTGYLIWRLWPQWKVALPPASAYQPAPGRWDLAFWTGDSGKASNMLRQLRVDAVLARFPDSDSQEIPGPYRFLSRSTDWSLVHWNDTAMLYLRNGPPLQATSHRPFRRLHPALPWEEIVSSQQTPEDWHALGADIRRNLAEELGGRRASELLQRFEAQQPGSAPVSAVP